MRDLLDLYERRSTVQRLAELHELVTPTLEQMADALGYERAFVALVDPDEGVIQGAVGINVPDELLESLRTSITDPPGPLGQAFLQGAPVRVDDALVDPRVPAHMRDYYAAFGMLAFAAIPLPRASGVLVVGKGSPLSEAELNELLPYAGRLSVAIAQRTEAAGTDDSSQDHGVEREWLWWMLNAVPDPVVFSDEQNNLVFQNAASDRLLKASPDDSPGKRRAIELNNFLLSAALSSFVLDQGASLKRELTLVDPMEGAELLFEVICRPATSLYTGQRGLVSLLKDVTDLRRATQELETSLIELRRASEEVRRERDRLNLILGNVADPIVMVDSDGQIILMNPPAERLLQPADDVHSDGRSTIYRANDAKLTSFLSQLRLEAAGVKRGEIQLTDPDSEEPLTMSVTATDVRDSRGQVTAVVSVLHDLTTLRELERRTVQQQLSESEKLAAVGRLAAAVAHEINNPLEAIKNSLYLLVTRSSEDDPNRRFLEIANKETERVSGIIRQMLGFYRPVATRAPTDINRVLEESLALLERELRRHKISVRCELDQQLPSIWASADQLKQVFLNLLLNAQEAMPHGGTLHLSTRLSHEGDPEFLPGRYVLVQCRDTGSGIPPEHLPHIFEPFYSTKSDSKGTGLGLWVSLEIVQDHGGQIKMRSQPGRGTTITVALPPEGRA